MRPGSARLQIDVVGSTTERCRRHRPSSKSQLCESVPAMRAVAPALRASALAHLQVSLCGISLPDRPHAGPGRLLRANEREEGLGRVCRGSCKGSTSKAIEEGVLAAGGESV